MAVEQLSEEERDSWLRALPKWLSCRDGAAIERKFEFSDFSEAFSFMTRVAMIAETRDHHPEWFNVYDRVEVRLTTHDADGVTDKDVDLARFMNEVATAMGARA